jgi:hypothetical protein
MRVPALLLLLLLFCTINAFALLPLQMTPVLRRSSKSHNSKMTDTESPPPPPPLSPSLQQVQMELKECQTQLQACQRELKLCQMDLTVCKTELKETKEGEMELEQGQVQVKESPVRGEFNLQVAVATYMMMIVWYNCVSSVVQFLRSAGLY